jgi:hypothetical protein
MWRSCVDPTQRHIQEDDIFRSHRCENLNSYTGFLLFFAYPDSTPYSIYYKIFLLVLLPIVGCYLWMTTLYHIMLHIKCLQFLKTNSERYCLSSLSFDAFAMVIIETVIFLAVITYSNLGS